MKQTHQKPAQNQRLVEVFTKFAHMKFMHSHSLESEKEIKQQRNFIKPQAQNIYTKVKSYFGLSPPKHQQICCKIIKSPPKLKSLSPQPSNSAKTIIPPLNSVNELQLAQNLTKLSSDTPVTLKHLHNLTNNYFLIGDQNQLDVINVNSAVGDYVDTELVISLNVGAKILIVAVDFKKCLFALITDDKQLILYECLLKKSSEKPKRISKSSIDQKDHSFSPKFAHFFRDNQLIIFHETHFTVYSIKNNQFMHKLSSHYPTAKHHNLKLFQVPTPYQNKLNVFFEEQLTGQTKFSLWCLEIDLLVSGVQVGQLAKVYDIQTEFRRNLKIENYSKDIYLLNLGFEIFAVKKGYVIDSVNVNIQNQQSFLCYLGSNKLIHVTKSHANVYDFRVKETNPPKIQIRSLDSIILPPSSSHFEFLRAFEMLSSNFTLFYQLSPLFNSLVNETRYKFVLTRKIPLQQKVEMILPTQSEILTLHFQKIEEKCNIVKKMGLSNREVYLRIWNITPKQRIEDFKFLLSTDHYETIKEELQKKLRKNSMSYRELQTLEKVCCQMLSQKVYGSSFDIINFKNFLISSFLIKKLELYFEFSKIDKRYKVSKPYEKALKSSSDSQQEQSKVMINIQDYQKFSKAYIKGMLLEYVAEFCIEQKPEYVEKIRVILKSFKFCLRIDYLELVKEIIIISNSNLLVLLETIPEILPYQPQFNENKLVPDDPQLYEGIWGQITNQQWQKNLHKQKVTTVYNKQAIEQAFQSDLWYKRNWNTLHGCVFLTKQQILQIHQKNKSQQIFYLVISQIYEMIDEEETVEQLLNFIQTTYKQVPQHLRNKIFLYKWLYDYFVDKEFEQMMEFREFLKLKDFELFELIFKYEKRFKNLIFSQIKPIFKEIFDNDQVFNQGLLNYFNSQLSQISDIKYLLNRMNNKKREFHIQNQQTYEVMVKAIQSKIKIGSGNDILIDEVLIYIENIPLPMDNEIMDELRVIEQINEEADKFREMRLNMSLYEIINNPDSVISALMEYQIRQSKIFQLKEITAIKQQTYRIIAESQAIKEKIYPNEQSDLTFFIYLTKLLSNQQILLPAKQLLTDKILAQYYTIDQMMIENLVLFMYKQKFHLDPVYVNSKRYIKKLVELLPEENVCRKFILTEMELAVYLSPENDPLWYPLTGKESIISVFELEAYINHLPNDMLVTIDPQLIYQKAKTLQEIASDNEVSNIHLNSIYEFVILKMIQNLQLRQALQTTKKYLQNCPRSPSDFLYPAMVLSKVFHEFCEENRQIISLCSRYLYNDPKIFVELLEDLITHTYNSAEQKKIMTKVLEKARKTSHVFNENSIVLEKVFMQLLTNQKSPVNKPEMYSNFDILLIEVQRQLLKLKDQFKTFDFHIIFALLSNDPYVLVKWVFLKRFQLNLKNFRCFLSYLIKEDLFNKVSVLELGKRLFKMIHVSINEHRPIDEVIEEYKKIPIAETQQIQRIKLMENQIDRKISKSLQRFKGKLKMVLSEPLKVKASSLDEAHSKITKMVELIKNPLHRLIEPFKYVFQDSDDDTENKESEIKRQDIKRIKKEERNIFDPQLERTLLMSRRLTGKQSNLYFSSGKSIPSNIFFSANFGIKGNMLNDFIKAKKFPTLNKSKDLFTNSQFDSPKQSSIVKNEHNNKEYDEKFPQKSNDKKVNLPKRKFNIAKAQSQYVNLDDFMGFEKLVNNITKQKQPSKQSSVPSINEMKISGQIKMQTNTQSNPGQKIIRLKQSQQQGHLAVNRHMSRIHKISEEIHDLDGTEYPSEESNLTNTAKSQESVIDIEIAPEAQEDRNGQTSESQSIQDEMTVNKIIEQILTLFQQQKVQNLAKIYSQLDQLKDKKSKQVFGETIKLLIQKLYDQNLPILQTFNIIKFLAEKYPVSSINKPYLIIYIRMAQIHSKFHLKFPFTKVFVASGLMLKKGSSLELYSYLSPFLESFIDEQNVFNLGKVLSLGFQKSEIEMEVHFILLKKFIKEISILKDKITCTSPIYQPNRQQDIALYESKIEKIQSHLKKIPTKVFIQKDQEVLNLLTSLKKEGKWSKIQSNQVSDSTDSKGQKIFNREKFMNMIVDSIRKRGDKKSAEILKNQQLKNL